MSQENVKSIQFVILFFFLFKKRLKVMYKTINRKKEVRKKEENQDQTRPLYKINLFQENIRNLFIQIMLSIHQA